MSEHSAGPRLARARLLYADRSFTLSEIARLLGVSSRTISCWAHDHGWPSRNVKAGTVATPARATDGWLAPGALAAARIEQHIEPSTEPPSMEAVVDRLRRIIYRTLEHMETRMSDDGTPAGDNPDRDMRVVGNALRSIEKLKELTPDPSKRDTASAGTGPDLISPDEEDRIRRKVVAAILKLRERKRREHAER